MSFEYKIERITCGSTSVCKGDRQGGLQFTALLYPVEYSGHLQVTQAVADEAEATADEAEYVSHLSSQTLSATRLLRNNQVHLRPTPPDTARLAAASRFSVCSPTYLLHCIL
jgi:hypothetical protein